MTRSQPQSAPTNSQAARSRGLATLIRMAVQDAIREERAAMAAAKGEQGPKTHSEVQP